MDNPGHNVRFPQRRLPPPNRHNPNCDLQTPRDSLPVRHPYPHSRPVNFASRPMFKDTVVEDHEDNDEEDDVDVDVEEIGFDGNGRQEAYGIGIGSEMQRGLKKQKMKSVMEYENGASSSRDWEYRGGRSVIASREWSENETLFLLEGWGDRYMELGRKSLRSEDWKELAERVSETEGIERSDIECRNKMDTLRKRYKKEKVKTVQFGGQCKWGCFKKMDMLLSISPRQQSGLACGVDSGEYVFMNPRVYLNCANGLDEMRDSPGNSEDEGDDSDDNNSGIELSTSFRYLADSIKRFGEIYENIENSRRQQMMELEKMRMDFQKEMESQKKQILDMAEAEIEKLRENNEDEDDDVVDENADNDDTDDSAGNLSR